MKFPSYGVPMLFVLALFTACNDGRLQTIPVTGTITLDGQPLDGSSVNFSPKTEGNGIPAFGTTNEKGGYKLQTLNGDPDRGTVAGDYIVTISKSKTVKTGRKIEFMGELIDEEQSVSILPDLYRDPSKNTFSATVEKNQTNHFDFDLQSTP